MTQEQGIEDTFGTIYTYFDLNKSLKQVKSKRESFLKQILTSTIKDTSQLRCFCAVTSWKSTETWEPVALKPRSLLRVQIAFPAWSEHAKKTSMYKYLCLYLERFIFTDVDVLEEAWFSYAEKNELWYLIVYIRGLHCLADVYSANTSNASAEIERERERKKEKEKKACLSSSAAPDAWRDAASQANVGVQSETSERILFSLIFPFVSRSTSKFFSNSAL